MTSLARLVRSPPTRRTLDRRMPAHVALVGVIVVVGAIATLRAPVFLSRDNLIELFRATSTSFIIACPLALLIIAGGFDFSVGATFSVGAMIACDLMSHGLSWPLAVAAGVGGGALTGLIGGALVVLLRVPPFIATLSVFFIATGLVDVLFKGLIAPLPDGFLQSGQDEIAGIPLLVIYAIACGAIAWTVLEKTRFGYSLRAAGGNRQAAHATGIRVRRIDLALYASCGAVAALAGIMYAARTSAGQPDAGGYLLTLQVLTMVLVGGVSLGGGVGSITGVALGALLLGEIQNALGVAQLDPVWSNVIVGVILATAVALDQLRGRVRFRDTSLTGHEPTAPSVNRLELQRLISGRAPEAERIMTAVSSERRRIQRDLHDGAQQQLVNASLILQLAIDQLRASGDDQIVDLLDGSREKLRTALAELRDLSRGIYPVVLREYGLISAIESLARRNAIPTQLDAGDMPQLPEHVEMTAYFLVAEALTNTVKHAHAARVSITVRHEDGALHVSVSDDGVGGADEANGSGIRGLRERIEAVQGYLVVNSAAGTGTRLIARLPTHALAK